MSIPQADTNFSGLERIDDISPPHVNFYQGDLEVLVDKSPREIVKSPFHTQDYVGRAILKPDSIKAFLMKEGFISEDMDMWAHGLLGYDFALLFQDINIHKSEVERIKPKELFDLRMSYWLDRGHFHDPERHVALLSPEDAELRVSAILVRQVPATGNWVYGREHKFEIIFPDGIDDKTYLAVAAHLVLSHKAFPHKSYEEGSDTPSPYDWSVQRVLADVRSQIHGGDPKATLRNWGYEEPWRPNGDPSVCIRLSPYEDMRWLQGNHQKNLIRIIKRHESVERAINVKRNFDEMDQKIRGMEWGEWCPDSSYREQLSGMRKKIIEEALSKLDQTMGVEYRKQLDAGVNDVKRYADLRRTLELL